MCGIYESKQRGKKIKEKSRNRLLIINKLMVTGGEDGGGMGETGDGD